MRSACLLVLPVIAMAAALSGCSVTPRDTRAAYEPITDVTASAIPMARLSPTAGDVVSVLESRVSGVLAQRIVLRGDPQTGGENQIVVKVDQSPRRSLDVDGPVAKPTESMIQSELDESFTTVDMRLSQTYNVNSFGPFGYAIGHAPHEVTCIYAWQFSAGRPPRIIDSPALLASASSMPNAPTSVRVRLCKAGLGEAEIVAILRDMQIYPPGSSDPYVDTAYEPAAQAGSRDALGAAGVPGSFFLTKTAMAPASEPAPARVQRHSRRHANSHERRRGVHIAGPTASPAREVSNLPPGRGVIVPLPGGVAPSPAAAVAIPTVNPLLAPLQGAAASRAAATPDDMPLPVRPTRAAPAQVESRSVQAKPTVAPIPLPN